MQVRTWKVIILLFRGNVYKSTRKQEHFSEQRSPSGDMLTMSGCLSVLDKGGGGVGTRPLVFLLCSRSLTDVRPTTKDLSSGGYSDPKEQACGGGLRERGLWDFSEWVCGRSVCGVSVGTRSGETSIAGLSAPSLQQDTETCRFLSLVSVLVHPLERCLGGLPAPIPHTLLLVPLRGPGGSPPRGLSSLCSLLLNCRPHSLSWVPAPPSALDKPPSPKLTPEDGAQRAPVFREKTQHQQA